MKRKKEYYLPTVLKQIEVTCNRCGNKKELKYEKGIKFFLPVYSSLKDFYKDYPGEEFFTISEGESPH